MMTLALLALLAVLLLPLAVFGIDDILIGAAIGTALGAGGGALQGKKKILPGALMGTVTGAISGGLAPAAQAGTQTATQAVKQTATQAAAQTVKQTAGAPISAASGAVANPSPAVLPSLPAASASYPGAGTVMANQPLQLGSTLSPGAAGLRGAGTTAFPLARAGVLGKRMLGPLLLGTMMGLPSGNVRRAFGRGMQTAPMLSMMPGTSLGIA